MAFMKILLRGAGIFIVVLCCLICCNSKTQDSVNDGINTELSPSVISYEGDIHFDSGKYLHLAVDLFPSNGTTGEFSVTEYVRYNDIGAPKQVMRGAYDVYHDGNERTIIVLQSSSLELPLRRTSLTKGGMIRIENFRDNNLAFLFYDDHLELLDGNENISSNPEDFFYKKASPEFTIEGYFMYFQDTAWIYETNTEIKWPLSKFGSFYQAARDRNTLAKHKYDRTYLRATGYCIESPVETNEHRKVLVLKKIIQSSISR
jgi:hypothetical protein